MKRRLLGIALLGAAVWLTTGDAQGFGGRKKKDCDSPCATTGGCGSPCGSYTVSYVDKKVTAYKTEWETKDVKVMVNEIQTVKENYKYIVCEPVTTKQKVTVKEMAYKDEAYKYIVHDVVIVKEKRKVCEYVCVPVQVTCVVQPTCEKERRKLFAGLCKKKNDCDAPCDPCPAPCPQVVTKTVMQRQAVHKEIEVDVRKCVPVEKTGTRKVCHWVDVEKTVDVTTMKQVEKTGTRDVHKCVAVEKVVKQQVAKQVAYETTVKVAVHTFVPAPAPAPAPCPAPCAAPCETPCAKSTCGDCGSASRGGLFKGGLFKGRKGGCGGCN